MSAVRTISAPLPRCSDLELVDRHRYGDEAAFEEVYSRFSSMVYGLCLRLSGSVPRAEDLTQEVFLRIFRSLGRFRGRSSLRTWIYRVTVNHCRSSLGRRRLPADAIDPEELAARFADSARSPESVAESHDAERRIQAALLELPTRFRAAVVLRDLEGLSYPEIAEVLGVRLGTVRSRIARGRERLRLALTEGEAR